MGATRHLAAILFGEVEGFSSVLEVDEAKAHLLLRKLRETFESEVERYHGRLLEERTDIVLCSFSSAIEAVRAAMAVQQIMLKEPKIPLSIGIHEGDMVFTDDDVIGDGVNIASRIESFAIPGSILISERIYEDIKNQADISAVSIGLYSLKNVKVPVKLYAISNQGFVIPKRDQLKGKGIRISNRKKYLAAFAGMIMIAALSLFLYLQFSNPPVVIDRSIAVLPFVDMSESRDQEYFSDGLSEELMNHLAQIPSLKVISRTSSFSFKGKNQDLRMIGEKLGVAHILEGSVRKDRDNLRITAQLVRTKDGTQLWSETFDRHLDDIFNVQNEISRAVVAQLKTTLINDYNSNASGNNIQVYNLLLQGRYFHEQRSDQSIVRALGLFNQALVLDSGNAVIHAELASVYLDLSGSELMDSKSAIEKARAEAKKAIALNPDLPDGYLAMGRIHQVYDWDWRQAESEYLKALSIDPENGPAIHRLASLKRTLGEFEESIRLFQKSIEHDPMNTRHYSSLGHAYINAHRFEEGKAQYRKVLKMNPDVVHAHAYISGIYIVTGKLDSATIEIGHEPDEGWKASYLPIINYTKGNLTESDKQLNYLISEFQRDWAYQVAQNYAWRNDRDKTFEWLEKAYNQRDGGLPEMLGDPLFSKVTSDPRYVKFLEKMNLAPVTH